MPLRAIGLFVIVVSSGCSEPAPGDAPPDAFTFPCGDIDGGTQLTNACDFTNDRCPTGQHCAYGVLSGGFAQSACVTNPSMLLEAGAACGLGPVQVSIRGCSGSRSIDLVTSSCGSGLSARRSRTRA